MCEEVEIARQWVAKASNDLLNADRDTERSVSGDPGSWKDPSRVPF